MYGLMAPLAPHGPQDATTTQQATREAITIEENKIWVMEKDAPTPNDDFPKHALRTHSSHGRAIFSSFSKCTDIYRPNP